MLVRVIKAFYLNGKKYRFGDIVNVPAVKAIYLAKKMLVKYRLGPVAHKMIMLPKEAKS